MHHAAFDAVGLGKLWLTLAICGGVILLRIALGRIVHALARANPRNQVVFWTDQAASLAALVCILFAAGAIWVNDPGRLTSFVGFVTAGLAIAAGIGIGSTTMEVTLMNQS